ncbi:DUF6114 domain-containing protein [Halorientalis halophila]|uniref:DUF6114 domain-containing protein n=1 Tax=Halorientalis halophila TaxID=3108499 RepID=UPI003009C51C
MAPDNRPLIGPIVVALAGLVIAAVPLQFAGVFGAIGAGDAPMVGLAIGVGLVLTGVAARVRPTFTSELGAVAIVLSLSSVFGALGGLGVGLLLGVLGGSLCVAWKPATS